MASKTGKTHLVDYIPGIVNNSMLPQSGQISILSDPMQVSTVSQSTSLIVPVQLHCLHLNLIESILPAKPHLID